MNQSQTKEDEGVMGTIKDLESQIASNITKLVNVQEIYNLPIDSLISILDSTEPLDTSTARILYDNIKKNYGEEKYSQILPHIKVSKENANSLQSQLSSIISQINDESSNNNNKTEKIQIIVKDLLGNVMRIEINPNETLLELKKLLRDLTGLSVHDQRIIFRGRQLDDNAPLKTYGIIQDCTIHLVRYLRG